MTGSDHAIGLYLGSDLRVAIKIYVAIAGQFDAKQNETLCRSTLLGQVAE